jgi:hypothetical protein
VSCLQYVYVLDYAYQKEGTDTHNLEHKHIAGKMQFPLPDTQTVEHIYTVGMMQFPAF